MIRAAGWLLLLPACAGSGPWPVHEKTGLGLRGLALEDLQSNRDGTVDLDAGALGVQAESFLDADTAVSFALLRRSYERPTGTVRALEYRQGLRQYFLADQPLQPFLTGLITVAGLDGAAADGLSWGIGAAAGGGLAAFLGRNFGLEAGLLYQGQVVDLSIEDGADGTRFDSTETIYGWSFEVQAAIYF